MMFRQLMYQHQLSKPLRMKRTFIYITAITMSIATVACSNGGENNQTTSETSETTETSAASESVTWNISIDESEVMWTGGTAGAMVYSHNGVVKIKEGMAMTSGSTIEGGMVAIDLSTIDATDDGYSEENTEADLLGHLASPDFFNTAEYPTATFKIKSVTESGVVGDLTVRGKTNEETLEVTSMEMMEDKMMLSGKLVFDRQKYDVAWAHYLQDVVLNDDIVLDINLVAVKG